MCSTVELVEVATCAVLESFLEFDFEQDDFEPVNPEEIVALDLTKYATYFLSGRYTVSFADTSPGRKLSTSHALASSTSLDMLSRSDSDDSFGAMAARALHGHREHERRATVPPDFIETAPTPKLDATPKPSLSEFPLPPSDDTYLLAVDRRSSVSGPQSAPAWIRDFAHESESALDDDDASTGLLSPLASLPSSGSRRASSVFPSSGGAYDHPGQFTHPSRHRPSGSGSGSIDYRASTSTYSSGSASLRPSMEGSLRPSMEGSVRPSMEGSLRPSMESSLRPSMDGGSQASPSSAQRVRKDSLPRKMAQRLRGLFNAPSEIENEPPVPVLALERKERVSMQRTRVGRGLAPMRRSVSGST